MPIKRKKTNHSIFRTLGACNNLIIRIDDSKLERNQRQSNKIFEGMG